MTNAELAQLAARIAGPIAAQMQSQMGSLTPDMHQKIATDALGIAQAIAAATGA
jgi:hypothetical protein